MMLISISCRLPCSILILLNKNISKKCRSKQRAFFVLDSWKGWGDWPFSRGRQGSPFPRGLPTHYPTAMWAAPEMNPTGRASSVKEEEQQHCKPIVLQHHSQIISKTRPQSQRPEIHIHSTCTMNAQTHVRGRQNIVLSDRTGTAEDDNCV